MNISAPYKHLDLRLLDSPGSGASQAGAVSTDPCSHIAHHTETVLRIRTSTEQSSWAITGWALQTGVNPKCGARHSGYVKEHGSATNRKQYNRRVFAELASLRLLGPAPIQKTDVLLSGATYNCQLYVNAVVPILAVGKGAGVCKIGRLGSKWVSLATSLEVGNDKGSERDNVKNSGGSSRLCVAVCKKVDGLVRQMMI